MLMRRQTSTMFSHSEHISNTIAHNFKYNEATARSAVTSLTRRSSFLIMMRRNWLQNFVCTCRLAMTTSLLASHPTLHLSLTSGLYREEVNRHGRRVKADMPTTVLRQANLAVLYLSLPGFALQLPHHFYDLAQPCRPNRMSSRQEPSGRIDGQPSS